MSFCYVFVCFCVFLCVFARFCVFTRVFECFCALEAILDAREALLDVLGALLDALGALLGALGTLLRVSWAQLGKTQKKLTFFASNLALKTEPSWSQNPSKIDARKRYQFRDDFSSFLKGLPSNLCSQNRSLFDVKCRNPFT